VAWNVRNTGVVSLVREDSTGYREVLGEGLPASGSLSIQLPLPLLPEPPYTVNLYLRAVGPADEVVEARTSVDVDGIIELDPLPTEEASDLSPELSDALPPAEATAEPVALLIVPVDPTA
jgi:hypothetical protein